MGFFENQLGAAGRAMDNAGEEIARRVSETEGLRGVRDRIADGSWWNNLKYRWSELSPGIRRSIVLAGIGVVLILGTMTVRSLTTRDRAVAPLNPEEQARIDAIMAQINRPPPPRPALRPGQPRTPGRP